VASVILTTAEAELAGGVAVADVSDTAEQRGSVGAGAAGDHFFEQ